MSEYKLVASAAKCKQTTLWLLFNEEVVPVAYC